MTASAKGPVDRVTIAGHGLTTPIEITDASALAEFDPWGRQFIAWDRGIVTTLPGEQAYVVAFYLESFRPGTPIYLIRYVPGASDGTGYVYIPGRDDAEWRLNRGTIMGASSDAWDPNGKWQHATAKWDALMRSELAARGALPASAPDAASAPDTASPPVATVRSTRTAPFVVVMLALLVPLIIAIRRARRT